MVAVAVRVGGDETGWTRGKMSDGWSAGEARRGGGRRNGRRERGVRGVVG